MGLKDFLYRHQLHIEGLYDEYLLEWKTCVQSFQEAMQVYFADGNNDEFAYLCEKTHKIESKADDYRRHIEFQLYSKALLPESRGDILGLLETIDKIINKCESVLYQIHLENLEIPESMAEYFSRILTVTNECLEAVYHAASDYFSNKENMIELARKIDGKESECDHIEREAIRTLFVSDLPWHLKFQLENLVIEMGNITDRAEAVADRLVITSVKRKV